MWLWALPLALAHTPGLSTAVIEQEELRVTLAGKELTELGVTPEQVAQGLRVEVDGAPCTLGPAQVSHTENDGLTLSLHLACPEGEQRSYSAPHLDLLALGHRQVVEAFGLPVGVVDSHNQTVSFDGKARPWALARAFVGLGVEHILIGYDHLTFLLALLLISTSLRQMLGVVTGFTLAHSVTLSLAATGVFVPPAALVEPAIAATIVYTGLENLWQPSPKRRFVLTFVLGLIHGFGFAGVLAERGLPQQHTWAALLGFNGGVELGQALVVTLLLPVLLRLRRWEPWLKWAVPGLSLGCSAMGLWWLWERVG